MRKTKKKKWQYAFNTLRDIKQHLDELEYKFECREPEKECNKEFITIKCKLTEHEMALKDLRDIDKTL